MKKILFMGLMLILVGCAPNNQTNTDQKLDTAAIYEERIEALNGFVNQYLMEIDVLRARVEILEEENTALLGQVDDFETILATKDQAMSRLQQVLFSGGVPDQITYGNDRIMTYLVGSETADQVVAVVERLNQQGQLVWEQRFDNLEVTEGAIYSPMRLYKDQVYIVVDGDLVVLDVDDGAVSMQVATLGAGAPWHEPVIDDQGNIYLTFQEGPFLMALSKNGDPLWSNTDENFYYPYRVMLYKDYLLVAWQEGVAVFDLEGNWLQ